MEKLTLLGFRRLGIQMSYNNFRGLGLTLAAQGSDGSISSVAFNGGGPFRLSSVRWPEWFVYMQDKGDGNVRGWKGLGDTQGDLIFTPVKGEEGYYLISTVRWEKWYFYIEDNVAGNVRGWNGDPGPSGYWKIIPKPDGSILLSTKKWPTWYMYMQNNTDGNIKACSGDPGAQAYFKLSCDLLVRSID